MTGSNKILTVSYGTFSCTLEGFDQPFNTMQSIAEYFRDLAAEDRYFGAEPPQPDAQMLHRIAQAEVQKRVEARVVDNGVALRQVEGGTPKPTTARPLVDTVPANDEAEEVETSPFASSDGDSVAAKLSRIRAVVAKARAERSPEFADDEPVEEAVLSGSIDAAFDGIGDEFSAEDETDAPVKATDVDIPVLTDATADVTDDRDAGNAETSDEITQTGNSGPVAEEARRAEQAEREAAAARQAEKAAQEAEAARETEEAERAEEAARQAEEAAQEAKAERETDEAGADDQNASESVKDGADADLADTLAARLADDDGETIASDDAGTTPAPVAGTDVPVARVIKLKRRDFEAALAAGEIEEVEDEDGTDDEDGDMIAEIDLEDDTAGGDSTLAQTDDAAEDVSDAEDEDEDDDLASGIRNLVSASGLGAEDEDDLVAELANVEREARQLRQDEAPRRAMTLDELVETEDRETDDQAKADGAEDVAEASPRPEGEAALNRLLDKTNAQLGDAEGHRRRSAIAHLKAAVAATKADDDLRGKRKAEDDEAISRFRDDLAQVVRPSRPASGRDGNRTAERPADPLAGRPAPLVLVSSQRVDQPQGEASVRIKPSRPTRIAPEAASQDGARTGESFSDFASRVGAHELPDILEAAAAYAKIVEGQEGLTRPAMLRRAASAADGEISREEGLQSFGQLLRSGRIRKLGHGQFGIDDNAEVIERARAVQ